MNKAFVKESDESDDDAELGASLPVGLKNYITPAGFQALKAEAMDLLDVQRPEMVKVVSWAASNGDRSENGDYLYGKRRLREIDRRIRFLTKRMDLAVIVDPRQQTQRDRVFFGAQVRYATEDGHENEITIVGIDEADPLRGKVSWISPVARALTKSEVGDVITLDTPGGRQHLEILEIIYPAPAD